MLRLRSLCRNRAWPLWVYSQQWHLWEHRLLMAPLPALQCLANQVWSAITSCSNLWYSTEYLTHHPHSRQEQVCAGCVPVLHDGPGKPKEQGKKVYSLPKLVQRKVRGQVRSQVNPSRMALLQRISFLDSFQLGQSWRHRRPIDLIPYLDPLLRVIEVVCCCCTVALLKQF